MTKIKKQIKVEVKPKKEIKTDKFTVYLNIDGKEFTAEVDNIIDALTTLTAETLPRVKCNAQITTTKGSLKSQYGFNPRTFKRLLVNKVLREIVSKKLTQMLK